VAREYGVPDEAPVIRALRERREAAEAKQRAAEHAVALEAFTLRYLVQQTATVQFTVRGTTYTAVGAEIPAVVMQAYDAGRQLEIQQAEADAARRSITWGT
jgi:hypothetical protein